MANTDSFRERLLVRDRLSPSLSKPPWVFLRIGGGVAGAIGFGYLTLMGLLIGPTITTGCFFGCPDEPNPLVGIPILLGTAAVGTLCLGALWWAFVDRYWKFALAMMGIAGSIGAVYLVAFPLGFL